MLYVVEKRETHDGYDADPAVDRPSTDHNGSSVHQTNRRKNRNARTAQSAVRTSGSGHVLHELLRAVFASYVHR